MPVRPNNLGQMPAVVAADKKWGFFVCVCLFLNWLVG